MKNINTILAAAMVALTMVMSTSCADKKGKEEGGDTNPSGSMWIMGNDLISKVEVLTNTTVIETYEFTYDQYSRVTSLVKRDLLGQSKLLDMKYTYKGENEMNIDGLYYMMTSSKKTKAVIDPDANSVTYVGDWVGAWTYTTTYNDNNTVLSTEAGMHYASTGSYYESDVTYNEKYDVDSYSDVASVVIGTNTSSKSSTYNSRSEASSSAIIEYTYSGNADNCNFNVFLVNCEFPVWFAKELPGCTHLIKSMKARCGDVVSPTSFTMEYKLNDDGQVIEAIRKDYEDKNPVLQRTYRITYL